MGFFFLFASTSSEKKTKKPTVQHKRHWNSDLMVVFTNWRCNIFSMDLGSTSLSVVFGESLGERIVGWGNRLWTMISVKESRCWLVSELVCMTGSGMDYRSERISESMSFLMFLFTALRLDRNLKRLQMAEIIVLRLNSDIIQSTIQADSKQWDSGGGYIVF